MERTFPTPMCVCVWGGGIGKIRLWFLSRHEGPGPLLVKFD